MSDRSPRAVQWQKSEIPTAAQAACSSTRDLRRGQQPCL